MLKTNRFRYVDWLAVEAGTSYHNEPYFFLLDEIDSFDHDEFKKHISVFAERRLTFFWYKTNKGYHIISPSMLDLKSWDSARKELVRVAKNYYHHLVLRIEANSLVMYFCYIPTTSRKILIITPYFFCL